MCKEEMRRKQDVVILGEVAIFLLSVSTAHLTKRSLTKIEDLMIGWRIYILNGNAKIL